MNTSFKWLGHSAFLLNISGKKVLIDPFISGNPLAPTTADSLEADVILLSHGHGDHIGDTVAIANRTNATVVCNFETGNWLQQKGVKNVVQGNTGGTLHLDFMSVKWTIAFHSASLPDGSYGGMPNGFLITANGKKLYFAGDTALFSDMQHYGEDGLDLAFLPIGDLYTMGIDDSLQAIRLLKPKVVTPMHYNTFPAIVQDAATWANRVSSETQSQPIVIDPGGSYTLT